MTVSDLPLTAWQGEPDTEPRPVEVLPIHWVGEIAKRVDEAPPTGFLLRPIWPADAYGVIAAEDKAGKSWAIMDLAVSVASGTDWMGRFGCDAPGNVLAFLGEGGERKTIRRLRAVCAERDVDLGGLGLRLCLRVPHLTSDIHLAMIAAELEDFPARVVIVDPLYLAARGARGSDLYEMGAHLEALQRICQARGAALVIVHHWNKTGEGRGAKRMSGVGPGAWGRVLVSAAVEHRHEDPTTGGTAVTLSWEFQGDEIPETEFRMRRLVWAEDQDDLASPMHYRVEHLADRRDGGDPELEGLTPAAQRVLRILRGSETARTVREIGDALAVDDTGRGGLKARTIQSALASLRDAELAFEEGSGPGLASVWRAGSYAHLEVRTGGEG